MSLVEKIKKLEEGMHHNTKVRHLEGMGSRKARLTVKEAYSMAGKMLDESDPSPNPRTSDDAMLLKESMQYMNAAMTNLKKVKETRKKKK